MRTINRRFGGRQSKNALCTDFDQYRTPDKTASDGTYPPGLPYNGSARPTLAGPFPEAPAHASQTSALVCSPGHAGP